MMTSLLAMPSNCCCPAPVPRISSPATIYYPAIRSCISRSHHLLGTGAYPCELWPASASLLLSDPATLSTHPGHEQSDTSLLRGMIWSSGIFHRAGTPPLGNGSSSSWSRCQKWRLFLYASLTGYAAATASCCCCSFRKANSGNPSCQHSQWASGSAFPLRVNLEASPRQVSRDCVFSATYRKSAAYPEL